LLQLATDTSTSSGRSRIDKALAALVLASCLVVPLLFTLAQRDAFALIKVTALQIIAVVGILLFAVRWFWRRDRPGISAPVTNIAVLVLVALNLAACVLSIHPLRSLTGEELQHQGFLSLLVYVCFFYLSHAALGDERRTVRLFSSIALGGTLVAVYALVQAARLDPIWPYPAFGRTFSTIGQPNGLAAYLVVVAPVTAALVPQMQTTTSRALVVLVAGLLGAAVLSTRSRGGYLGFVASGLILAWPLARSLRLRPRSLLAGLAVLTLVGLVLSPVRETMTVAWRRSASSTDLNEWSVRRHLDLWAVATSIAVAHPLFGTGQETFPEVFPQYAKATLGTARARAFTPFRVESPHNVYLAIAAGAGFPALAAYLAVIASLAVLVAKAFMTAASDNRRLALAAVLAAMAGHLVTDTFMTAEVTSTWLFWVLMGVGLRIGREKDPHRHTLDGGRPLSAN
jgi:putative inorganic carbon (HCO3(-)) transporter